MRSRDGNEEQGTRNRSRSHSHHKLAKNWAELCLCLRALWKEGFMSIELGYQVEEISKKHIEGASRTLLTIHNTMREERNYLKIDFTIKWVREQKDFETLL